MPELVTLTEDEIAQTIAWLWREEHQRVEGAGACATGAVLLGRVMPLSTPAVVVVSGGNIDLEKHAKVTGLGSQVSG